jgi:hypothetical protein
MARQAQSTNTSLADDAAYKTALDVHQEADTGLQQADAMHKQEENNADIDTPVPKLHTSMLAGLPRTGVDKPTPAYKR